MYRIVHNFRAAQFSWMGIFKKFRGHNFRGSWIPLYSAIAPIRYSNISWSLIFEVRSHPRKMRKLCALKIRRYSVHHRQWSIAQQSLKSHLSSSVGRLPTAGDALAAPVHAPTLRGPASPAHATHPARTGGDGAATLRQPTSRPHAS